MLQILGPCLVVCLCVLIRNVLFGVTIDNPWSSESLRVQQGVLPASSFTRNKAMMKKPLQSATRCQRARLAMPHLMPSVFLLLCCSPFQDCNARIGSLSADLPMITPTSMRTSSQRVRFRIYFSVKIYIFLVQLCHNHPGRFRFGGLFNSPSRFSSSAPLTLITFPSSVVCMICACRSTSRMPCRLTNPRTKSKSE